MRITTHSDVEQDQRLGSVKISCWEFFTLAIILLIGLYFRIQDFNEPWSIKGWQHLGAFFSIMARNFTENGYLVTKFAPAIDPIPPADGVWSIYLHHPPLFPILLSLSFQLFGVCEWSARLLSIVASLIGLAVVWAIARRLFGFQAALATAVMGAVIPATAFYGSIAIEYGPVVIMFTSLAFLYHLKFLSTPSKKNLLISFAALFAAMFTNWNGYFMAAAVFLHLLLCKKRREAFYLILVTLTGIGIFLIHAYLAVGSLTESHGGNTLEIFYLRTWGGIIEIDGFGDVVPGIAKHFVRLYTWPVLILAGFGLTRLKKATVPGAVPMLLLAGSLDILIFLEGALRHDFWNITLAPALIISAGAGLSFLVRPLLKGKKTIAVVLVVASLVSVQGASKTLKRFKRNKDDYAKVFGEVIRNNTNPHDCILTSEFKTDPLLYYARRNIQGPFHDELIPEDGLPESLAPADKIVLPERKSNPFETDRLMAILRERYPETVIVVRKCRKVHIFDLNEKKKMNVEEVDEQAEEKTQ
ncbi:MAG: glycosyltransferase family 39 protein [Planctomycetes bacterium]|nr:glycosyltransferase family 39 protein [Planctomycetota bacterium]